MYLEELTLARKDVDHRTFSTNVISCRYFRINYKRNDPVASAFRVSVSSHWNCRQSGNLVHTALVSTNLNIQTTICFNEFSRYADAGFFTLSFTVLSNPYDSITIIPTAVKWCTLKYILVASCSVIIWRSDDNSFSGITNAAWMESKAKKTRNNIFFKRRSNVPRECRTRKMLLTNNLAKCKA